MHALRKKWMLLAACAAGLWGCAASSEDVEGSGEDGDATGASDRVVLERLEELGFDSAHAVIRGNAITVDGDILLYRDRLLAGEYGQALSIGDEGRHDKGYRATGSGAKVNTTHDGNIKLLGNAAFLANPDAVTAAVVAAMQWSLDNSIHISGSNTGPGITLRFVSTLPCQSTSQTGACAEFPSNGRPGANIYILSSPKSVLPNCSSWNQQLLLYIIGHEMGHALGFTHPAESGSAHISGSGSCPPGWGLCPLLAPYDTLMNSFAWGISGCGVPDPYLGEDDFLSSALYYPG